MPKKKARPDTLEANLDVLLELYGKDNKSAVIVRGNDDSVASIRGFVSTGCDLLDCLMSYLNVDETVAGRGWALGRWYELFGPPSASKSTATHHAAAEFQKLGGFVVQLDTENATDDNRAMRMGFDTSKCLRIPTDYMEQGVDELYKLLAAYDKRPELLKHPTLIIFDSIAVIPTKKEFEEGMNSGGMMEKNRKLKQMIRKLCSQMPKYNASMLMVNQTMLSFKQFRGRTFTGTTTPGGDGPRFQYSVRLQLKPGAKFAQYDDIEIPAGMFVDVTTAKTKLFRPEGQVSLACEYLSGYNNAMTNVHFLWHNVGLIKEVKKRYFIPSAGIRKGLKFAELMKRANEDTELRGWMRKAVYDNSKYIYVNPEEEEKEDKKAVKK
jgi:recombination protein RecA